MERHWNTVVRDDGVRDDSIETEFYAKLDNALAQFIDQAEKALASGLVPVCGRGTKKFLAQFLYNYVKRNPGSIRKIDMYSNPENYLRRVGAKLIEEHPDHEEEIKMLGEDPEFIRSANEQARIAAAWLQNDEILELMAGKNFFFAEPPSNKQFCVFGSPLITFYGNGDGTLRSTETETWTMLSPRLALCMSGKVLEFDRIQKLDVSATRALNVAGQAASDMFGGAARDLVASLAKAR